MTVLIVTEREGTITMSLAVEGGSTRQLAVMDAEGAQTSHADLAALALNLSRLMSWNGHVVTPPVTARKVPAQASPGKAAPARALPKRKRVVRSPEQVKAFHRAVIEEVRMHPGLSSVELADRMGEGKANMNLTLFKLREAGALYRSGRGNVGDRYRYRVVAPPDSEAPAQTGDGP